MYLLFETSHENFKSRNLMFLVLFYFSQSSTHQPSFPTNSSEPKVSFLAYWGIFWQIHVLFDTHNMGVSTVSVVSPVGHTLSTASSWCWKQKRVIASSTYHEPVTRVNMGFTICGFVLWRNCQRSWKLIWFFDSKVRLINVFTRVCCCVKTTCSNWWRIGWII